MGQDEVSWAEGLTCFFASEVVQEKEMEEEERRGRWKKREEAEANMLFFMNS